MQNVGCTEIAMVNIAFALLFRNCYHPRIGADIFACIIYPFTFKPLFYRFESSTSMLMKSNEQDLFLILRQGNCHLQVGNVSINTRMYTFKNAQLS